MGSVSSLTSPFLCCSRVSVLPETCLKRSFLYSAHSSSFDLGMTFVLELVNSNSHTKMVPGNFATVPDIFSTGACLTCGRYCILPCSSYKAYTWLLSLLVRSCRRASEMLIPLLVQELNKYSCGRKPFLTSPPSLEFLACLLLYGGLWVMSSLKGVDHFCESARCHVLKLRFSPSGVSEKLLGKYFCPLKRAAS